MSTIFFIGDRTAILARPAPMSEPMPEQVALPDAGPVGRLVLLQAICHLMAPSLALHDDADPPGPDRLRPGRSAAS